MTTHLSSNEDSAALEAFTRRTELPLLLLALAMVPLLLAPVLLDLSERSQRLVLSLDWFIWAAFALDLGVRTHLAPRKRRYLVENWLDVVIVVIPFLRPVRVLRSARALRLLRLVRVAAFFGRFVTSLRIVLSRHRLDYALLSTLGLIILAAALVSRFESRAGGSIDDFGTALWWAFVTVTTVGYGDYFPVSAPGRAIGVVLMVTGIGLFSLLAANVAAFFVSSDEERSDERVLAEIRELRAEIRSLRSNSSPESTRGPGSGATP